MYGGELKIVAAIADQPVIEKILKRLGLQVQPTPMALASEPGPHHER